MSEKPDDLRSALAKAASRDELVEEVVGLFARMDARYERLFGRMLGALGLLMVIVLAAVAALFGLFGQTRDLADANRRIVAERAKLSAATDQRQCEDIEEIKAALRLVIVRLVEDPRRRAVALAPFREKIVIVRVRRGERPPKGARRRRDGRYEFHGRVACSHLPNRAPPLVGAPATP